MIHVQIIKKQYKKKSTKTDTENRGKKKKEVKTKLSEYLTPSSWLQEKLVIYQGRVHS